MQSFQPTTNTITTTTPTTTDAVVVAVENNATVVTEIILPMVPSAALPSTTVAPSASGSTGSTTDLFMNRQPPPVEISTIDLLKSALRTSTLETSSPYTPATPTAFPDRRRRIQDASGGEENTVDNDRLEHIRSRMAPLLNGSLENEIQLSDRSTTPITTMKFPTTTTSFNPSKSDAITTASQSVPLHEEQQQQSTINLFNTISDICARPNPVEIKSPPKMPHGPVPELPGGTNVSGPLPMNVTALPIQPQKNKLKRWKKQRLRKQMKKSQVGTDQQLVERPVASTVAQQQQQHAEPIQIPSTTGATSSKPNNAIEVLRSKLVEHVHISQKNTVVQGKPLGYERPLRTSNLSPTGTTTLHTHPSLNHGNVSSVSHAANNNAANVFRHRPDVVIMNRIQSRFPVPPPPTTTTTTNNPLISSVDAERRRQQQQQQQQKSQQRYQGRQPQGGSSFHMSDSFLPPTPVTRMDNVNTRVAAVNHVHSSTLNSTMTELLRVPTQIPYPEHLSMLENKSDYHGITKNQSVGRDYDDATTKMFHAESFQQLKEPLVHDDHDALARWKSQSMPPTTVQQMPTSGAGPPSSQNATRRDVAGGTMDSANNYQQAMERIRSRMSNHNNPSFDTPPSMQLPRNPSIDASSTNRSTRDHPANNPQPYESMAEATQPVRTPLSHTIHSIVPPMDDAATKTLRHTESMPPPLEPPGYDSDAITRLKSRFTSPPTLPPTPIVTQSAEMDTNVVGTMGAVDYLQAMERLRSKVSSSSPKLDAPPGSTLRNPPIDESSTYGSRSDPTKVLDPTQYPTQLSHTVLPTVPATDATVQLPHAESLQPPAYNNDAIARLKSRFMPRQQPPTLSQNQVVAQPIVENDKRGIEAGTLDSVNYLNAMERIRSRLANSNQSLDAQQNTRQNPSIAELPAYKSDGDPANVSYQNVRSSATTESTQPPTQLSSTRHGTVSAFGSSDASSKPSHDESVQQLQPPAYDNDAITRLKTRFMASQSKPEQKQMGVQASENAISDIDVGTTDSINYLQSMERIRSRASNNNHSVDAQQSTQQNHSSVARSTHTELPPLSSHSRDQHLPAMGTDDAGTKLFHAESVQQLEPRVNDDDAIARLKSRLMLQPEPRVLEQKQMGAQSSVENAIRDTGVGTMDSVNYLNAMERIRSRFSNDSQSLQDQQITRQSQSFDESSAYRNDRDPTKVPDQNAGNKMAESNDDNMARLKSRLMPQTLDQKQGAELPSESTGRRDTDVGTIDDSVNYLNVMDRMRTRLSNDSQNLYAQQKSQHNQSFDAGATYKRDSDRTEAPYRNTSNKVVESTQPSEQFLLPINQAMFGEKTKRMVRTNNLSELFNSHSHQPMKRKHVPRQLPFNSTNSEGSSAEPSQHNGSKERLQSPLPQPNWQQSVLYRQTPESLPNITTEDKRSTFSKNATSDADAIEKLRARFKPMRQNPESVPHPLPDQLVGQKPDIDAVATSSPVLERLRSRLANWGQQPQQPLNASKIGANNSVAMNVMSGDAVVPNVHSGVERPEASFRHPSLISDPYQSQHLNQPQLPVSSIAKGNDEILLKLQTRLGQQGRLQDEPPIRDDHQSQTLALPTHLDSDNMSSGSATHHDVLDRLRHKVSQRNQDVQRNPSKDIELQLLKIGILEGHQYQHQHQHQPSNDVALTKQLNQSAQVMHDKTSWINQPAQSLQGLNRSDEDVRNLVLTTTSENSFNRLESKINAINHPSPNVEQNGPISLLARQRQYQFISSQAQGQNLRMFTDTMDVMPSRLVKNENDSKAATDKSKEQISYASVSAVDHSSMVTKQKHTSKNIRRNEGGNKKVKGLQVQSPNTTRHDVLDQIRLGLAQLVPQVKPEVDAQVRSPTIEPKAISALESLRAKFLGTNRSQSTTNSSPTGGVSTSQVPYRQRSSLKTSEHLPHLPEPSHSLQRPFDTGGNRPLIQSHRERALQYQRLRFQDTTANSNEGQWNRPSPASNQWPSDKLPLTEIIRNMQLKNSRLSQANDGNNAELPPFDSLHPPNIPKWRQSPIKSSDRDIPWRKAFPSPQRLAPQPTPQKPVFVDPKQQAIALPSFKISVAETSQLLRVKTSRLIEILQGVGETRPDGTAEDDNESWMLSTETLELIAMEIGQLVEEASSSAHVLTDEEQLLLRRSAADVQQSATATTETGVTQEPTYATYPVRAPVVCIMGHVDHGKTTLMDALRRRAANGSNSDTKKGKGKEKKKDKKKDKGKKGSDKNSGDVAGTEAGGITQVISAFQVPLIEQENSTTSVTFLDTPGHAAFTAMRQSGSDAADIIVLVVAADDGVSEQTIEILNFYKSIVKGAGSGGISLVVAMNKIDKPGIDVEESSRRIQSQLLEHGILTEGMPSSDGQSEYGPAVQMIPVSGLTGLGLDDLIDGLVLQSEMMDLRAPIDSRAEGIVMDARIDKGIGIVADCVVRWGSIQKGDVVVSGTNKGRVRLLKDIANAQLQKGLPSQPVRIVGFDTLPKAGDPFVCVESEEVADELVSRRKASEEASGADTSTVTTPSTADAELQSAGRHMMTHAWKDALETKYGLNQDGVDAPIRIPVVIKADADGTLAAIRDSLVQMGIKSSCNVVIEPVKVGVGPLLPTEIQMAQECNATIICFNVKTDQNLVSLADENGVQILRSDIIYTLLDEAKIEFSKYLPEVPVEIVHGRAKVLAMYDIGGIDDKVAGLKVVHGKIYKDKVTKGDSKGDSKANAPCQYRVFRDGNTVASSLTASSLKHFKDDVDEVNHGKECGISLSGHNEYEKGDEIECITIEMKRPTL
jgi:small GTP-binding protein